MSSSTTDRVVRRQLKLTRYRPSAPRELGYDRELGLLTWKPPADKNIPFTHYRIRLGRDNGEPNHEVSSGQLSLRTTVTVPVYISAYNANTGVEGPKAVMMPGPDTTPDEELPPPPGDVELDIVQIRHIFKSEQWYVEINIPYHAPSPIGTFDRIFVFLQAPDDAVITQKATITEGQPGFFIEELADDSSRIVSLSEPEYMAELSWNPEEPIIKITRLEPQKVEQWRVIVTSGSPYYKLPIIRADELNPTPNVAFNVGPHSPSVLGAEIGPNARNVTGEAKYRLKKGNEQFWRPKINWTLPTEDPRFAQVDFWDIFRFDPTLVDVEATPGDDRLGLTVSVGANETEWIGAVDWRVPDAPSTFKFWVRPSRRDGTFNTLIDSAMCTVLVEKQLVEEGSEFAGVVTGVDLEAEYRVDKTSGRRLLYLIATWTKPANDTRYAGVILEWTRSDNIDWANPKRTSVQSGERAEIRVTELPTEVTTFYMHWLSVNADGEVNTYYGGITPDDSVEVNPPHVEVPVPNVTDFTVDAFYEGELHHGADALIIVPHFTLPVDPDNLYTTNEFWAKREDDVWYLLGYPALSGDSSRATINSIPRITYEWQFALVAQDSASRNRDGVVDTDPEAGFPAGTPTYALVIQPPVGVGNVTDMSVTHAYVEGHHGQKVLELTVTFTRPTDKDWASAEFWAYDDRGEWIYLGDVNTSGYKFQIERLPTITANWYFRLVSQDKDSFNSNGEVETNPGVWPVGTPYYPEPPGMSINPPSEVANISSFTVAYAYMGADYYGITVLTFTPTFTPPADTTWAYAEFWMKKGADAWQVIGYPSSSAERAVVKDLPSVATSYQFMLVSYSKDGRNSAGQVATNPLSPPSGTPTYTLASVPTPSQGVNVSNITAANFAASVRPVGLGAFLPSLPDATNYPIGSLFFNTSNGKLYRNTSNVWVNSVDAADITVNKIMTGQIQAGAITTTELASTEILVGLGGGKPTKFKVVDMFGVMIGFIGEDSGFVGGFFKRIKVAPGLLSTSPRLELTSAGLLEIEGGSVTIGTTGADTVTINNVDGVKIANSSYGNVVRTYGGTFSIYMASDITRNVTLSCTGGGGVVQCQNGGANWATLAWNGLFINNQQVVGPRNAFRPVTLADCINLFVYHGLCA